MNPRIQVEHTVASWLLVLIWFNPECVAQGLPLDSDEIGIPNQAKAIETRGAAIQCRITEDPKNHFMPDTGRLDVYRTGSGFGIRLDGGNGFATAEITPY